MTRDRSTTTFDHIKGFTIVKKWIKLLRVYDGKPVGEIYEVDEAIARALVAGGVAEDATATADGLLAQTQTAELRAQMEGYTRAIADTFRAGVEEIRAARPDLGRIDPTESEDDKKVPTGGFRSLGHYAHDIFRGRHPGNPDPAAVVRLNEFHALVDRVHRGSVQRGTPSGMSESIDPDGGGVIPTEFAGRIWERARTQEMLMDRIDMTPVGGNTMVMPADAESSRVDGQRSGGIQGFWEGEADQYQKSKPTLRKIELKLKKLTLLAWMTNELLEDSGGALDSYLTRQASKELVFKTNFGIVRGTGAGMPAGMINALCRVTQAAVAGQGAGTLTAVNIINMWARLYAPCRPGSAWFINQNIEPQLAQLTLATGTYSGQLVYMPPTGLSNSVYATLQGRPVIPLEQCSTLGTEGDIILADLSQYVGIKKAAGMQQSVSIHLRFDYDETCFKFTLRMDAQPAWQSPLTPYQGTATQSPIITLSSNRT
jgi:HK97 family phage major capsid protein